VLLFYVAAEQETSKLAGPKLLRELISQPSLWLYGSDFWHLKTNNYYLWRKKKLWFGQII